MALCYWPWALYCYLLQHCNQPAPMAPFAAKHGHVACKKDPLSEKQSTTEKEILLLANMGSHIRLQGKLKQEFGALLYSDSGFGASRCLSQFQECCCSHIKRKCALIIAWKEERHGLDLNKSNLGKKQSWKEQTSMHTIFSICCASSGVRARTNIGYTTNP